MQKWKNWMNRFRIFYSALKKKENIFYAEESDSKVEFEIPEEGLSLYGNIVVFCSAGGKSGAFGMQFRRG